MERFARPFGRTAIIAVCFGAGAALMLEAFAYWTQPQVSSAAFQIESAHIQSTEAKTPEFTPGEGSIETASTPPWTGGQGWADLTPLQKTSVLCALAAILSVVVGAIVLARQRAEARWLAARERRKLLAEGAPLFRNSGEMVVSAEAGVFGARFKTTSRSEGGTSSKPRSGTASLGAYLSELERIKAAARRAPCESPASNEHPVLKREIARAPIEPNNAQEDDAEAPITWRTAHDRRMRRLERIRGEGAAPKTLEDRRSELNDRIIKFGSAQTKRRKSAEAGNTATR